MGRASKRKRDGVCIEEMLDSEQFMCMIWSLRVLAIPWLAGIMRSAQEQSELGRMIKYAAAEWQGADPFAHETKLPCEVEQVCVCL